MKNLKITFTGLYWYIFSKPRLLGVSTGQSSSVSAPTPTWFTEYVLILFGMVKMKHMHLRTLSIPGALLISLCLTGCASLNLDEAADLAGEGTLVSGEIGEVYSARLESLETYLEGEYLLSGLKENYSPPSSETVEKVDAVISELILRKEMFAKLSETYMSFADLAAFSDSSGLESSIRELSRAIDDYSSMTGNSPVLTRPEKDIASELGGEIFQAGHRYAVRSAGRMIRKRLESVLALLERQSEKAATLALDKEIERGRLKTALALWESKLGLPDEILEAHISAYGLKVNRKETIRNIDRMTDSRMQKAISKIMEFRHTREVRRRLEAYDASLKALRTLISAHRALEEGERFSVDNIRRLVSRMSLYSGLLAKREDDDQ